jgi:chitodextrinase
LTWVAATDNIKVTGYRIYANNIIVTTTNLTDYTVMGLKPDSTYSLYIIAYDAAANLSDTSNVVEITTIHGIDVMPPSIPEGLTIYNLTSEQISFRWDPSTDNEELLGYRVYVNEELMTTTSLTEFSLIDLIPNIIYSFYIRAVDVNGNISGSSIKISASTNGEVVIVTGVGDINPSTFNLVTFLIGENKMKVKIPTEIQNIEKVEIYNLSGRLIYSSNSIQESQLINMEQADPFKGVYILVLTNRNFIVSKKFIY